MVVSTIGTMWHSSTKIDFILSKLDWIWDQFRTNADKARSQFGNILIFSQWIVMLDYIGVGIGEGSEVDCSGEAWIQVYGV